MNTTAEARPHLRLRPRPRLTIAAAVVAVAALAASFAWWGQPRLGAGGLVGIGTGMTWANDGVENTRMLVRGRPVAPVTATFSISNDGHLPFTVHGLDVSGLGWLEKQQVTFVPGMVGMAQNSTPVRQVTLRPGTQATVYWSVDLPCQIPLSEGNRTDIDALPFKVSLLGISTVRELPLAQPITFVGDAAGYPGAACGNG
jgi:hypothetical protein